MGASRISVAHRRALCAWLTLGLIGSLAPAGALAPAVQAADPRPSVQHSTTLDPRSEPFPGGIGPSVPLQPTSVAVGGTFVSGAASGRPAEPDLAPVGPIGIASDDGLAVEPTSSTFTPRGIPCYSTGPWVEVFYGYAAGSSNRIAAKLPIIREAVARADDIYARSAAIYGGIRHIRWLMTSGCKLSVTAVSFPAGNLLHSDPQWFFDNLVARRLLSRSEKGVVFLDEDEGGGLTQPHGDDRPGQDNGHNKGGSMSLVFGGSWDLSGFFTAGWVTAHEITHGMGAVESSAPHYARPPFPPGHCTDDDDILCRGSGSVCPRTLTGLLDCNGDDYFNLAPPAGSYLAKHWNVGEQPLPGEGRSSQPGIGSIGHRSRSRSRRAGRSAGRATWTWTSPPRPAIRSPTWS